MDLLRHLRFFVAVAEEGHFRHAADRLGMTQPPLSHGIRRLEDKLGVTLLTRTARGVGLTAAGAELLPRATALLADAARFTDDAQRHRDAHTELRIGVVPQLPAWHVAAVVDAVRRAGARATATVSSTVELVAAVVAGQLDCAVVHHPALVHPLECGAVVKLPADFLVPEGRTVQRFAHLRDLALATAPRSHNTAACDLLVDSLRAKGIDPALVPAPTDRDVVAAVAAGAAFGLTADPGLCAPGVARVALGGDEFFLRVRLVWRTEPGLRGTSRTRSQSTAMPSVEERIRDTLRQAGATGWVHAVPIVDAPSREVAVGADELVVMASVYKLPLLVGLCARFADGTLDPTATVRVHPASGSPGPTGIAAFLDPVTVSWRDLAASMIAVSDNAAADVILGEVGLDAVRAVLAGCGLSATKVVGGQADVEAALVRDTGAASAAEAFALLQDNDAALTVSAYDPAFASATTAREMTRLLTTIWSDAVVDPAWCAFMRRLLGLQVWPHRVRAGFPYAGVVVAGKTGTIGAIRNEVAVVTFPEETPIAVAVFTFAARADAFLPAVDAAVGECARLAVTELRSGRW